MSTQVPLLIRLAVRQLAAADVVTRYDYELDELLVLQDGQWIAAVDMDHGAPKTKKFDIEKGEDVKGRW
jgi:hypothetical protein